MSNYTDNIVSEDPNHVWNKLLELIPENSTVLDIGCSSGNLDKLLIAQKKCTVDGVEPDQKDAKLAAKALRQVWSFSIEEAGNIGKLPVGAYDVIIFADVLEHLVHPADILHRVKPLLKVGGRVVFSVPNMAHISVRLSLLEGNFEYTETGLLDKTHLHFYDRQAVHTLFESARMNLEKFDASMYQYSKEWIGRRLETVGMIAKQEGIDMLRSDEASAFQYVGYATYTSGKVHTARLQSTTPAIQKDVEASSAYIRELETVQRQAEATIANLRQEVHEVHERLRALTESKTFRTAQAMAKPYRTLRKTFAKPRAKV